MTEIMFWSLNDFWTAFPKVAVWHTLSCQSVLGNLTQGQSNVAYKYLSIGRSGSKFIALRISLLRTLSRSVTPWTLCR